MIPSGDVEGEETVPEPVRTIRKHALAQCVFPGLVSGVLLAASFPPYNLPFLMPFGIALLLLALQKCDLRSAAYTGAACGLLYFGATLFWLVNLFGAAAISLIAILSLFPLLFAVCFVWLRDRLPLPDWLIAAVVWTAWEYFRSELFILNFGWMGLGYGVIFATVWAVFASVVGTYGIAFVIVCLAGLLVVPARKRWYPLIPALCWLVTLYLPHSAPHAADPLPIHLVQAFSDDTDSLFAMSKPQRQSTDPVPQIIVWPEYSINSDPTHDTRLWERLRQVAITNDAYFLFGAKDIPNPQDDDRFRNTAYLLNPQGDLIARHVKNHPVHLIHDGIPGTDARAAATPLGKWGVGICFDMDYPDVARRLADDGAEVFLIPNMDPAEWGDIQRAQHRLMFQMRAAECGRWLARADVAGGTSACAPDGQIVAAVHTSEATVLNVTVGRRQEKTLFVRGGWRFGQCCFLLMIAGMLWGTLYRRSAKKAIR